MYVIAIIGDLFGIIPIVNIVSDLVTAVALGIAGSETGVSLYSSETIGATLVTLVIEAIPGISIVPAWTIRVYFAKKRARELQGG